MANIRAKRHFDVRNGAIGRKLGPERSALQGKLRLLYLAVDRRDEALRSRAGSSVEEQEFWSEELFGLSTLFDPQKPADAGSAPPSLRRTCDRRPSGLATWLVWWSRDRCTEVKGYGTFLPFAHDEFNAGQEVLLYCEVENFQSKLVAEKGYHTALKAKYEVFSEGGNRVAEKDLGLKEEHCLNRRRDFFVPYFLWLPKQVPSGKYQLKLTLEDVHGGKSAESTIDFVIKEK